MGANLIITGRHKIRLNETLVLLEGDNHNLYNADLRSMEELQSLVISLADLDGFVSNLGVSYLQRYYK